VSSAGSFSQEDSEQQKNDFSSVAKCGCFVAKSGNKNATNTLELVLFIAYVRRFQISPSASLQQAELLMSFSFQNKTFALHSSTFASP
jgi:hypothetical protein